MDEICQEVLWARLATFHTQLSIFYLIYDADHDQSDQPGHSKTNKTRIKIITDANGEPELPSVTKGDGYQAKKIQLSLREYCTAHIRESNIHSMQFCVTHMN